MATKMLKKIATDNCGNNIAEEVGCGPYWWI